VDVSGHVGTLIRHVSNTYPTRGAFAALAPSAPSGRSPGSRASAIGLATPAPTVPCTAPSGPSRRAGTPRRGSSTSAAWSPPGE